ncbi:MAG: protein tyrosine phosphatase [Gemmataceae bacterium]|nr:protein tyrosine phosphatase [Gemmataceae bacterium]
MPPLVDIHVHLLAGLDDGPKTPEDAVEMCRRMVEEGIGFAAAGAHQNDEYPDNTPDRLRAAEKELVERLRTAGIPLKTKPSAEIMVGVNTLEQFGRGELLTVGDTGRYVLVEMPHGLCVEMKWLVEEFVERGVRPILGHAERVPEVLHDPGRAEGLIQAGCLFQVSSKSITNPPSPEDGRAIKSWFKRRMVHLLGSDGHSLRRRPPVMKDAYRVVEKWVGAEEAERIGSLTGQAVLEGRPVTVPKPLPATRNWFAWLTG